MPIGLSHIWVSFFFNKDRRRAGSGLLLLRCRENNGGKLRWSGPPLPDAAPAGRVVVLEFPDLAAARAWYDSADYQVALAVRQATSSGRVYFVDGYDPA